MVVRLTWVQSDIVLGGQRTSDLSVLKSKSWISANSDRDDNPAPYRVPFVAHPPPHQKTPGL